MQSTITWNTAVEVPTLCTHADGETTVGGLPHAFGCTAATGVPDLGTLGTLGGPKAPHSRSTATATAA